MMTPLLKSQIDSADQVAINKIDTVEMHEIERVVRSVKDMTEDPIPVTLISAEKKTNIKKLLEGII
jgi:G3E family GTPase